MPEEPDVVVDRIRDVSVRRPSRWGRAGCGILTAMLSLPRRLLALVGLIVLLFVACGMFYVALQLRNGWWLLGAVAALVVLVVLWVRTIVAMRRAVRRRRATDPDLLRGDERHTRPAP